jgi:two-component system CitB family sensor kinase
MRMLRLGDRRNLASQVLAAQVLVLTVTLAAGFLLAAWWTDHQAEQKYEQRALAVATAVASLPDIGRQVTTLPPGGVVETEAMAVARRTGAQYVVVTNGRGIRYSHPDRRLIGRSITYADPEPVSSEPFRTGKPWVGLQHGTLGDTARGKAPILLDGRVVGEVSVGFPVGDASEAFLDALPSLAGFVVMALLSGIVAALLLARRLKRQTFGLELKEIASLLQEREALLHGISDGVLGYDRDGRVVFANDAARELLALADGCVGSPVGDLLPPGPLLDALSGADTSRASEGVQATYRDRLLTIRRRPLRLDHRHHTGWIATLHDRTEPETLLRKLDQATGLAETLRAQSHEFSNQLHTFVGLLELGLYDEAKRYVTEVSARRVRVTESLRANLGDSRLVAMLLAKTALAEEAGVNLSVAEASRLQGRIVHVADVLTVVGNLVDNAIDATAQTPAPRQVDVSLTSSADTIVVEVRDSGPGVPAALREAIFENGYTTKASTTGIRRGLGLALVRQVAERRGGHVGVVGDQGATFSVVLPACLERELEPNSACGPSTPPAQPATDDRLAAELTVR